MPVENFRGVPSLSIEEMHNALGDMPKQSSVLQLMASLLVLQFVEFL
jgi:hypothetical protein